MGVGLGVDFDGWEQEFYELTGEFWVMGVGTTPLTFSGTIQFHHKHETLRRRSDATSGQLARLYVSGAGESREIKK